MLALMKRAFSMLVLSACGSHPPPLPSPTASPAPLVASSEPLDAGPPSTTTTSKDAAAPPPAPVVATYPTAPDDTDALILRREACNGRCPIYSVGVTSNGNVHFYGEQFTHTAGYAFGTIGPEKVAALYKFMDAHPVSAAEKKSVRRPDHPTEYVLVHRRGAIEKWDPPGKIATQLDEVLDTAQWVGTDRPMITDAPPLSQAALEAMLGKQLRAFDKCATAKTEIKLSLHITPEGKARSDRASGKKEADSTCISKVIASLLLPLADVNVATLDLAIGK